jgi:hypothetical protein
VLERYLAEATRCICIQSSQTEFWVDGSRYFSLSYNGEGKVILVVKFGTWYQDSKYKRISESPPK